MKEVHRNTGRAAPLWEGSCKRCSWASLSSLYLNMAEISLPCCKCLVVYDSGGRQLNAKTDYYFFFIIFNRTSGHISVTIVMDAVFVYFVYECPNKMMYSRQELIIR